MAHLGIIFALVALVAWGFGDFLIQEATRVVGSWRALFYIGVAGSVALFPFVVSRLPHLTSTEFILLAVTGFVVTTTSLFNFEALRQGKMSVVEPIIGFELPLTVGLAVLLGHQPLTLLEGLPILVVFMGIVLAVTTRSTQLHLHRRLVERGAVFAIVAAVGIALTNVLIGVGSEEISPLMVIWFTHTFLAIVCGIAVIARGEWRDIPSDVRRYPLVLFGQSTLDNVAWVAFAYATTHIPIAIATAVAEGYVALAVLLGLLINRERLQRHQMGGIIFAVLGILVLASISS